MHGTMRPPSWTNQPLGFDSFTFRFIHPKYDCSEGLWNNA